MVTQKELMKKQSYWSSRMETMPQTKIQAFLEEFPWIRKHVGRPITQAYVSRIAPQLLEQVLQRYDICPVPQETDYVSEYAFLLDKDGQRVDSETEEMIHRKKYFFFGPVETKKKARTVLGVVSPRSSIQSRLCELGKKAQSVHFILSYSEYTHAVIVYKQPQGMTIQDWVRSQIEAEKAQIKSACAEIDAEAKAA